MVVMHDHYSLTFDEYAVGWFRYRRNTPLRPSVRELSVHSRIEEQIRKLRKQKAPVVLGLFTFSNSKTKATHSYDYRLFTTTQRRYILIGC
jgi:hypothetical protein